MRRGAPERLAFERSLKKWQARLDLDDFAITVRHERLDGDISAETWAESTAKRAIVVLNSHHNSPDKKDLANTDLDRTAAHEAAHVATNELFERSLDHLERYLGRGVVFAGIKDELHEANERLCERISIGLTRWERGEIMPHTTGRGGYRSSPRHPKTGKKTPTKRRTAKQRKAKGKG